MITTKEIWKDIPGFAGKYQASTFGRIKSEKKLRALIPNKDGYYRVALTNPSGRRVNCLVHNLVWNTFAEEKSTTYKTVVDHKDENKGNNYFSNLQLLTNRKNIAKHFLSQNTKTSKYTGVCWKASNQKWMAQYKVGNKLHYAGQYENEYDAHLAYEKAVSELSDVVPGILVSAPSKDNHI